METHDGSPDSEQSRVKRLYDELAAVLRRLSPERRKAFREYLRDEQEKEAADDSRDTKEGR
jgi:hypothetical protein